MEDSVAQLVVPVWFRVLTAFLFGISIGSFLNVVIYRLPRGKSVAEPQWSFCPNCQRRLQALDLVPLLSFLLLGRKCRGCKKPISWRYFLVELLTGALFVAVALHFAQSLPHCIAFLLFTAVLIPIFFIDLDTFTIPDSLNILALIIPIGLDVWGIVAQNPHHALAMGWLPRSVLGIVVGWAIFAFIRLLGWLLFRQEAMGLGDVLLARAMGAMLALLPGSFPMYLLIWILLSSGSGAVLGILFKYALPAPALEAGADETPLPEVNSTLPKQLADLAWSIYFGDFIDYVKYKFWRRPGETEPIMEDDEFALAPTAIPFGPYLVAGFLLTVFFGNILANAYLNYAFPPK